MRYPFQRKDSGWTRGRGFGAAVVVLLISPVLRAQLSTDIVRVEEDWSIELIQPDGDLLSPQFHTVIAPFGDLDHFYAQFTWNYRELPDFRSGGFEVQGWSNNEVVHQKSFNLPEFSNTAETVKWTQVMASVGGHSVFAILGANSSTWGPFGGLSTVITELPGVANLNSYSTDVSIKNSWVTYGSNRVASMRIVEVRYLTAGGTVFVDSTPKVVASSDSD